jgi:hypothetical protein
MILGSQIHNEIAKYSVSGKHEPNKETYPIALDAKLPKAVKERLGKSVMSEEAYLAMVEYAKWLPRGKRQLRLNTPQLKELLLSNDLKKTALTKTSGLNRGGKLAFASNQNTKQVKQLLTQAEHIKGVTIMNNNRVSNSFYNFKGGKNPNPTSFKNNIRL